jgi:hypothetical protein
MPVSRTHCLPEARQRCLSPTRIELPTSFLVISMLCAQCASQESVRTAPHTEMCAHCNSVLPGLKAMQLINKLICTCWSRNQINQMTSEAVLGTRGSLILKISSSMAKLLSSFSIIRECFSRLESLPIRS